MFANLAVTTGEPASAPTNPARTVYSLYGDTVFVVAAAPHALKKAA